MIPRILAAGRMRRRETQAHLIADAAAAELLGDERFVSGAPCMIWRPRPRMRAILEFVFGFLTKGAYSGSSKYESFEAWIAATSSRLLVWRVKRRSLDLFINLGHSGLSWVELRIGSKWSPGILELTDGTEWRVGFDAYWNDHAVATFRAILDPAAAPAR